MKIHMGIVGVLLVTVMESAFGANCVGSPDENRLNATEISAALSNKTINAVAPSGEDWRVTFCMGIRAPVEASERFPERITSPPGVTFAGVAERVSTAALAAIAGGTRKKTAAMTNAATSHGVLGLSVIWFHLVICPWSRRIQAVWAENRGTGPQGQVPGIEAARSGKAVVPAGAPWCTGGRWLWGRECHSSLSMMSVKNIMTIYTYGINGWNTGPRPPGRGFPLAWCGTMCRTP